VQTRWRDRRQDYVPIAEQSLNQDKDIAMIVKESVGRKVIEIAG
jgi:hypothetical protein